VSCNPCQPGTQEFKKIREAPAINGLFYERSEFREWSNWPMSPRRIG